MCILNVLVLYVAQTILYPQQVISIAHTHITNTLKQTKINITADDATPNPLLAGEEALLDAGEEAAATAMEA